MAVAKAHRRIAARRHAVADRFDLAVPEPRRERALRVVIRGELLDGRRRHRRCLRDIETNHLGCRVAEHPGDGFGIDVEIELRCRGDVTGTQRRAAHQVDLVDDRGEVLVDRKRGREVGLGADRDDREVIAVLADAIADELDAVLAHGFARRFGRAAPDPARSVDLLGGFEVATQRAGTPPRHGHVGSIEQFEDRERVVGGVPDGGVAGDGAHADDLDPVARERDRERNGIVAAWIGIEEDFPGHTPLSWAIE